ncbi:MAG: hypothetical protein CMP59_01865 [Flavobacteriales bacterium]|nr:hypothetical protein [Flavobacteriales bacterium]|tara:strand:+ start:135 stop:677 length:543 start_codon:yes stop_codon:yes gene_type:complete
MKYNTLKFISPFIIAGLIACGGETKKTEKAEEKEVKTEETTTETVTEEVEQNIEKEVVEINLAATGEDMTAIAFEPKSLTIPAESRVKLTFENKSQAAGMFHNFVLVKLGSGQEIATAGIKAGKENNFVPKSQDVFAYSEVVDMGKSITIEFDAPPKGSYHYICTYPGHYPNMIGRLNVE